MCYIDLEPCEVWQEHTYRARKAHTCGCCGRTIQPGLRYVHIFLVFEGDASFERSCLPCWHANGAFADAHDGMRCTPSSLVETIAACIDEGDEGAAQWKRMLRRIEARRPLTPPPAGDPGGQG